MSVIGEQIKKYRIQKKFTQEKLGGLIGVTTQAVSKWERGGTPDAEVLPLLADALEVSIDALFGREDEDLKKTITKRLSRMPKDEAFRSAFNFCWSILLGLAGDADYTEDIFDSFVLPDVKREKCLDYFAKALRDEGLGCARISGEFSHFFLMVQPKGNSILPHFESEEAIRQVFALFADKKLLKIIYFLYTMPCIPATATLISEKIGLDLDETERCMKILCDKKIVHPAKIASVGGEINSYIIRFEADVLPMLCYADEIAKGCPYPFFGLCDRKTPSF